MPPPGVEGSFDAASDGKMSGRANEARFLQLTACKAGREGELL